ncbi:hypothetical protein [Streptomyces sp. 5-10]|uniref:hypothetical protein n=1 Tax=Streptomyces sp. 5-10 TaxID=878925 RepID=UPI00168B75DA|nr:hypothetical protein [Streptomyces sp. 5-10]MBD3004702.1 hypothetical protein [Streptomyces sp. 5-10]
MPVALSNGPTAFLSVMEAEDEATPASLTLTVQEGGSTLLAKSFAMRPDDRVWSLFGSIPDTVFEEADRVLGKHGWQRPEGCRWVIGDIVYGVQSEVERIPEKG